MGEWQIRILGGILMSHSYRKNVFGSWFNTSHKMKNWRTQENQRLRHNAKQLIANCSDYDALVVPVLNDYDTLWGSPNEGRRHYQAKPLLNQCEVDLEKAIRRAYRWNPELIEKRIEEVKEDYKHNGKNCNCYSNKKSFYWILKRK